MAGSNVNKTVAKKKLEICGHCNSRVMQGICCDCCGYWVHYRCEDISDDEAKAWGKLGSRARFYCTVRSCNQIAKQFIECMGPIREQVDSNTRRIEILEKKLETQQREAVTEVNRAISEASKTLECEKEKIRGEVKKEIKDEIKVILQGQKPAASGAAVGKEQVKVEVQEVLEDEKDKAYRARNLILLGVPEPDTDDLDVGNAADLKSVTLLFDSMKIERGSYKITSTTRLFRGKHAPKDTTKDRLLKVRFEAADMVGLVARASPELDRLEHPWAKDVRIFRDRSKKEREERKELLKKAETRNAEEQDKDYKWHVDFRTKEVFRKKEGEQRSRPFQVRKYR